LTTAGKIYAILTPPERRRAAVLLGLMFVGMMLETLGIGLIIPAISLLVQGDVASNYPQLKPVLASLGNPTRTQLVTGGMLTLVAVYLIKAAFLAFLAWRQTKFSFDVQANLSQRLFTTYLRQPYTFHLQRNSAQLIRNAIKEVAQFVGGAITPGLLLIAEGLVIIGVAILLLIVEPLGAVIVVLVLGVAGWTFQRATRAQISRWGIARQIHEGLRLQHLQQGLGGAKDVKLLGRESDFLAQFKEHNTQSARVGQFEATLQQLPRLWLELLGVAGLATLVLTMLAQGRNLATIVPTLGLFAVAAFRLMPSINRVLIAVQALRYGRPAINTLYEELKLAAPDPALKGPATPPFRSEIRLTGVSFTYATGVAPAIDSLSICIEKGEAVGFVGPSGSGKSTLVDIIMGLLTPSSGQVAVDGKDIQHNLRAWQDQIGYVPQSIYLTDDTLRRNIAFGLANDQINDAAVLRAVKAAQLEEFVNTLPKGLATRVGERGVRLSGGQRQRIGIARALYHDPGVLVLDEATSALDAATERDVMRAVTALQGSKTVLIVAHRTSTVESCDRLYKLVQGKVVETGSPTSVLVRAAGS
jgi:ABC-type multidrug transport system fused ATPase/permease subunit